MVDQNHAHLRYLMAIYSIAQKNRDIPSVEVARVLGVSKPAVARMLKQLMEKGLIVKKPYGCIYLTDKGIFLARNYQAQLDLVRDHFPDTGLDLTPEEVERVVDAAVAALPQERFFKKYEALFEEESNQDA